MDGRRVRAGFSRFRARIFSLPLLTLLLLPLPGRAGFHDGGVASCSACHLMHGSEDGIPSGIGGPELLIASTASEVCLSCHASEYGAVLGSNLLAPPPELGGGNFVFLLEDNLNDAPGGDLDPIDGNAAGHNVIAPEYGLMEDPYWGLSPGGDFPSDQFGCTSCHDPHGNGNFRFLYGEGPVQGGIASFANAAPGAEGIDVYFDSEPESPENHTAYRNGMSEWCANCHESFLHEHVVYTEEGFEHETNDLLGDKAAHYNRYNGTDDPQGGTESTAYLPEVPFEDEANTVSTTYGPRGTSRIICLSCHRAHASSGPHAGRWDFFIGLLAEDGIVSGSYPIPDPYASPNQVPLCEKCHEIESEHDGP